MSSPQTHLVQSAVSFGVLYPAVGMDAAYFSAAIIFIDLDHVIEFFMDTKSLNPFGFFSYYGILEKHLTTRWLGINVFHTLEFYGVLSLLAWFWNPSIWYALGGFLFHHASDQYSLIRRGMPWARVFSFVEFFIRYNPQVKVRTLDRFLEVERGITLTEAEAKYVAQWYGQSSPLRSA